MCDITNNNNSELSTVFESKDQSIVSANDDDELYEEVLDKYHKLEVHKPFNDNRVGMKLIYIDSTDTIYGNCMLISWAGNAFIDDSKTANYKN